MACVSDAADPGPVLVILNCQQSSHPINTSSKAPAETGDGAVASRQVPAPQRQHPMCRPADLQHRPPRDPRPHGTPENAINPMPGAKGTAWRDAEVSHLGICFSHSCLDGFRGVKLTCSYTWRFRSLPQPYQNKWRYGKNTLKSYF